MRVTVMLFLITATVAHADVYKSTNANGEVIYSDQPAPGSERLRMPPLPSYTAPVVISQPAAAAEKKPVKYATFALRRPADMATIRNNLGTVTIETRLDPPLMIALDHRIQFYLDGQPRGGATQDSSLTLDDIDRGEHQLSASVLDASGEKLISTAVVTVHVKRNSKLHGTREGTFTDNPGYITDKPNITGDEDFQPYLQKDIADFSGNESPLDDEAGAQLANPGYLNRNPNILSPNPNIISPNPNQINPPLPEED